MTDDHLAYLKENYQEWRKLLLSVIKEKEEKKTKLKKELQELENNEIVKKYFYIKKELDSVGFVDEDFKKRGEEDTLIYCGVNFHSNGIYVCVGECANETDIGWGRYQDVMEAGTNDLLLPIDSVNGLYRVYLDIESGHVEFRMKDKYIDFEKGNMVVYPGEENPLDFYRRVQLMFFKICAENTQEEAIEKVLELKK